MDDAEIEAAEEQYIEDSPLSLATSALRDDPTLPSPQTEENPGVKAPYNVSIAEATKYPMESLDASMKNFGKVLQVDLNRLFRHTVNIARTSNESNWKELHEEETKTAATVHQVSAILKEVAKTRLMVKSEDLPVFEWKAKAILEETLTTMDEVLPVIYVDVQRDFKFHIQQLEKLEESAKKPKEVGDKEKSKVEKTKGTGERLPEGAITTEPKVSTRDPKSGDGTKPATVPGDGSESYGTHANPHYPESSVKLQEAIQELSDVIHAFFLEMEHREDPGVTEAEKAAADAGPTLGFKSLFAKSNYYKNAFLPVVGAMVGGVMAGPVGLAAGAIGGAMGYAGGRYVRKHRKSHDASDASDALREIIDSRAGPCKKCDSGKGQEPIEEEGADGQGDGEKAKPASDDVTTESQSSAAETAASGQSDSKPKRGGRARTTSFSEDIVSDISEVMHAVTGPFQKFFHKDNKDADKND